MPMVEIGEFATGPMTARNSCFGSTKVPVTGGTFCSEVAPPAAEAAEKRTMSCLASERQGRSICNTAVKERTTVVFVPVTSSLCIEQPHSAVQPTFTLFTWLLDRAQGSSSHVSER